MKYISFGRLSVLLLYPFCSSIFSILRFLVIFFANKHNKSSTSVLSAFSSSSVVLVFYMFLGEALNGFLLISYFKNDKQKAIKKNSLKKSQNKFTLIKNESKKRNCIIASFILFFGFIECTSNIFLHEIAKANPALTALQYFQIIFTIVLAYFLLNVKWYKHQWLSSSFIVVGAILSVFFFIVFDFVEHNKNIYIMLGILVILALQEVLEKGVFLLGISAYELLLYEGLCGIVLCLLINTFSVVIHHFNPTLLKFFGRNTFSLFGRINELIFNDIANIFFLLAYIILNMLYSLFIKSANYYYTPMSRAVSDTISIFINNLIYQIDLDLNLRGKNEITTLKIILVAIGFTFILIGCFLYNEIIILKCSGLSIDTKEKIIERSYKECNDLAQEREQMIVLEEDFDVDIEEN